LKDTALGAEQARKAAGLSEAEAAALIGLSKNEYYDLQSYDDEVQTCLSLHEVRSGGSTLRADPVWLLTGRPSPLLHRISLSEAVDSLRAYVAERHMPVSEFENLAGWGVSDPLAGWRAAWNWNVDGPRDIRDVLGLDYRALLLREDNDARI
jgi:hypothetical protein